MERDPRKSSNYFGE